MADKHEIDDVTGIQTTGHEWDGIKELNKPLPKWWVWTFYVTVIWSVGYWIAYPAWPSVSSYTKGLLGYSQRQTVTDAVAAARAAQSKFRDAIAAADLAKIKDDPELLNFALAGGKAAFGDNCAPCHGRGAQGFKGYPNLNDDDWIWGGKIADIHQTVLYGIRSDHDDTRSNDMPRFGLDEVLTPAQISDVAEYTLSLSSTANDQAAAERGKEIFAEQCVACHGDDGKGNQELGSPNLTDALWLYGGEKADVVESIQTGRGGVMPAFTSRLDGVTIKQLAVYVHSLGGGQ